MNSVSQARSHTVAILAFNNHVVTEKCVARVRDSGFSGELILLDNGSEPSFEALAHKHSCVYVRNKVNRYVNPAWNQIFERCTAEYLTLLNNDCLVRDKYLASVVRIMESRAISLLSPTLKLVETVELSSEDFNADESEPNIDLAAPREGHVMTISMKHYRRCRWRIPRMLLIWGGDDWIWGQLRARGYACGRISNWTCVGEKHSTIRKYNEIIQPILDRDAQRMNNSLMICDLLVHADPSLAGQVLSRSSYSGLLGAIRYRMSWLRDRIQMSF